MELVYSRTTPIQEDKVSGFCPGCMHSTVVKLIGEALEEMNLVDKAVMVTGIGCCGLHMDYIAYDTITAPHGRACAVATGMKRSNPDTDVYKRQKVSWRHVFLTSRKRRCFLLLWTGRKSVLHCSSITFLPLLDGQAFIWRTCL